jgi:predicted nucleic acid binding AN1-type Zn finger protein
LKSLLALRTNLPTSDLRLVFAGKHLTNPEDLSSTLSELLITSNSTLHLALPLRGGMAKKPTCDYKKDTPADKCKEQVQRIVGDCGFCQGHFCAKHRLLESHNCPGLEDCKKESHERNANKLIEERTVAIKGV